MRRGASLVFLWAVAASAPGCGRLGFEMLDGSHPTDAGRDAAAPRVDAGMDAGPPSVDAGMDAARDTGTPDAGHDTASPEPDAGCADDDGGCPPPVPPCAVLPAPVDPCVEVPYLGGPPLNDGMLDGVVECGPPLAVIPQIGWTSADPIPPEHEARYTMGYRDDGVYIYIEVTDADRLPAILTDPPWMGDSVEIYLDSDGLFPLAPTYDQPGAFQIVIAAPADDVTPTSRATLYANAVDHGPWASSRFGTFPTPTGYVMEAWFSAADLGLPTWTLLQAGHIGFNISLNVSARLVDQGVLVTQGTRLGQYFLHIGGDPANCQRPYCSSDAFCTPELK